MFIDVSAHGLQTTTTANLISSASQEDHYWTVADDDFFQSDEFAQSLDAIYSPSNRYVTQNRSSNGKLAYVVFAGHDIGVFYNWYVDCQTLLSYLTILIGLRALLRRRASQIKSTKASVPITKPITSGRNSLITIASPSML
jgi:hypothetical protein